MEPTEQCAVTTTDRATGEITRCYLPTDHKGQHDDGCLSWCEVGDCRCDEGERVHHVSRRLNAAVGVDFQGDAVDALEAVLDRLDAYRRIVEPPNRPYTLSGGTGGGKGQETAGASILGQMGATPDSPTGTDAQPARYTRADGRETLDVIRDVLGDAGFIAFCIGNAMKYEDRTGKKGDAEEDRKKARFYRQMAAHVRGEGPDPRSGRPGFVPYCRLVDHNTDRAQVAALGEAK